MNVSEKVSSLAGPRTGSHQAPTAQMHQARRTLHRVETATLDLSVGVRVAGNQVAGHLLNVSAGGCCVRVQLPLTLLLDSGVTIDVALPLEGENIICASELTGLDVGKGSARLRLRFQGVAPKTRRALLVWIGELVTRDLQQRHTGGARKLAPLGGQEEEGQRERDQDG